MSLALMLLLDLGGPRSPVAAGWQPLGPGQTATTTTVGWLEAPALTAVDQVYPWDRQTAMARDTAPRLFSTDLTRDALIGAAPARLQLPLPAGDYLLWALGGSPTATRGQWYDFTVAAGDGSVDFEMSSGQWLETRQFRFRSGDRPVVTITPRTRWALGALIVCPASAAASLAELTRPIEDGIYFVPPELQEMWVEEPYRDPVGHLPPLAEADRARGYLVHQRHWSENVYPTTLPYGPTLNPTLRAFASLDEREPLTCSIYALRELTGCRATVSPLRGPGTIDPARLELKMIQYARARPNYVIFGRYRVVPDYLRPVEPVTVAAAHNQRYWLTVHVPADARPGLYRGSLTFTADNAPSAAIPIELRVLDIRLQQDPTRTYGIYYRDPLDQAAGAPDDETRRRFEQLAETEAADMVAHGTVPCVPLSAYVGVPADPARPIVHDLDWELLGRKIDRCRRYGYRGPLVMSLNTGGLYARHQGGQRPGSHLAGVTPCPPAFVAEMTAMVRFIEAGRTERGWPEFLYYPVDEPGGAPEQVAFMLQCLQAIRAAGARTYVTADPTRDAFQPLRPYVDVWCTQPFSPSREEIRADMAARGVDYWCYPNHVNGENDHTMVVGARMTYGFGFWRSGFSTLIPWIYSATSGHPYNNLDGGAADFFNRPGAGGAVWPSPMWEAYREGYDDYRYVYTLQQALAAARQAGRVAAADAAQRLLDELEAAIEVKPKYKLDSDVWGYREFDVWRWRLAEAILQLPRPPGG